MSCVTLGLSLRKGRYFGHLQWDSMGKSLTAWANLYGVEVLVMGDTIFAKGHLKVHKDSVSYSEDVVWKVCERIYAAYGSDQDTGFRSN